MRSPPMLPRRRGRLQPDPNCCGPGSDGLTAKSNANMDGRSFARPGGQACGEEGHYLRHSVSCLSSIASEKDLSRARDGRYSAPCGNFWRRQARFAQQTPKMMVAVD